jgi:hypothetical protein
VEGDDQLQVTETLLDIGQVEEAVGSDAPDGDAVAEEGALGRISAGVGAEEDGDIAVPVAAGDAGKLDQADQILGLGVGIGVAEAGND